MEELYWDAIAITAPKLEHCTEFIKELKTKQNEGLISQKTNLLSIPDPSLTIEDSNGQHSKIGSGSSMINSLYVITEKLSALDGKNYLDVDIFKEKRILLLMIGGIHQNTPIVNICTKSFSILPIDDITLFYAHGKKKSTKDSKDYVGGSKPVFAIDVLLSNLNRLVCHLPEGLMICSTESIMFMDIDNPFDFKVNPLKTEGVTVFTMDIHSDLYTNHGVCKVDSKTNQLFEIAYKQPMEQLKKNGFINQENDTAKVYTSMIFFSETVSEKILYLYNTPPIDSCTYLGIDNGNQILKFGIFPDILCTMTKNETFESYMNKPVFHNCNIALLERGRKVLWNIFRDTNIYASHIKGKFYYLKSTRDFFNFVLGNEGYSVCKKLHTYIDETTKISGSSVITNSILTGNGQLGNNSIVTSTALNGPWKIGSNCVVMGVQSYAFGLHVRDNMICHEVRLKSKSFKLTKSDDGSNTGNTFKPKALVMLGIDDNINMLYTDPGATIANRSWDEFFEISGVSPDELWPPNLSKTLKTARLFPVLTGDDKLMDASLWIQEWTSPPLSIIGRWRSSMRVSISDIIGDALLMDYLQLEASDPKLQHTKNQSLKLETKQIIEGDISAEFAWRRELDYIIDTAEVEHILLSNDNKPIIPFFIKWKDSQVPITRILSTLDRIAISCHIQYCGRILSCISDLLSIYVDNRGGLRSGPARNSNWQPAFENFTSRNERKGFLALAKERDKWLSSPENMIRAARHYEGAGQIVVKNIVDTCQTDLKPLTSGSAQLIAKFGEWAHVTMPARIDLAGGWSDTPPICYEHGGYVINAAIRINGRHPIQVKAKRIKEPQIMFYYDMEMQNEPFICSTSKDLSDYSQPSAPCALLKACFLLLGLVDLEKNLAEQLTDLGGGMILCSTSNLPTGSGLGTSSILAGGIITTMAHIYGYQYSQQHLVHAILKVEQMLTTSGGYQDQVGGIVGGVKESSCSKFKNKNDKIEVIYNDIPMAPHVIDRVNQHILLIYTGRTRLARDLLQDVIRRWYSKTTEIITVTDALVSTAKQMKCALSNGDIPLIGKLLNEYWIQKKYMASGAEPTRVSNLIKILSPYSHGIALAGAGGGGFMIAISKEPTVDIIPELTKQLSLSSEFKNVEFYQADIDPEGMKFSVIS
ncbi:L-fucose kinase [Tieghemostelium lacteum]|uniref:L-fucose kinase n=1 Tax=Tieghemostelium lacteum TaxID=361077 RepID=A0A151Z599_TIELA|nr:L-fucose kinase [Tieghemostelium lacteum]|eukprot:KYQ89136.1 L-fucose kinase [Tieghemostelium lacteum]